MTIRCVTRLFVVLYAQSVTKEVIATKGSAPMAKQALDQRGLTFEQSRRLGETWVIGEFLTDFMALATRAMNHQADNEAVHAGWTLSWRVEPTPRIQVRTVESKCSELVKATLQALGYQVRDKGDHLVVIL